MQVKEQTAGRHFDIILPMRTHLQPYGRRFGPLYERVRVIHSSSTMGKNAVHVVDAVHLLKESE